MDSKKPEFDDYAANYDELTRNPIRDRFAENKVFFHTRKWSLIEDFFRQRQTPLSDKRWLDMGCGKGELLSIGESAFGSVAGCDFSAGMLSDCKGIDVRVQSKPTELPFEDQSFDFVTAVCVYHHVPPADRPPLTKEVFRLLKPGGIFCIIEHNPLNPLTQMIVRSLPVDKDAILLGGWETRSLQRGAGLTIQKTVNFLFFPELLYSKLSFVEGWLGSIPMGGQYAVFAQKE